MLHTDCTISKPSLHFPLFLSLETNLTLSLSLQLVFEKLHLTNTFSFFLSLLTQYEVEGQE